MYIFSRSFGQTAASTNTTTDSTASTANSISSASNSSNTITVYTTTIINFRSKANLKDWKGLLQDVTTLLNNPDLALNAGTLVAPLQDLQSKVQIMANGGTPDVSADIQNGINKLVSQAEIEATATPDNLLINQELLMQRLYDLSNELQNFNNSNSGFKAVWNKITGQDAVLFAPLQSDLSDIANDISITPLTASDRTNILNKFLSQQENINTTWQTDQNVFKTVAYALLAAAGTATIAAAGGYLGETAKLHAVKHATKHAKKLHGYITGRGENQPEIPKPRRKKNRK